LWREENWNTWRKTLIARREPTTNSTHIWCGAGIEPGPHWWEASTLTTAPSLLLYQCDSCPWKFDDLKTGIFALEALLLWQMFVNLRTSNLRGATISRWFS